MQYVKKMCILRQIKQGFSGDGKTLSGLIKIEQYGKNLAVEVSIINFAPLSSGEYYCLLSDGRGKTEMLSLRGKSIFNILSDIDVSGGFCGIICYVKTEVVPIAYGINGNGSYDWRAILNKALPPVFPKKHPLAEGAISTATAPLSPQNEGGMYAAKAIPVVEVPVAEQVEIPEKEQAPPLKYDDEAVAQENYFGEEHERIELTEIKENARPTGAVKEEGTQSGADLPPHENAADVRAERESDEYYNSVKREIDELFSRYPQDKTLCAAFPKSEWIRIRGTAKQPQYLVGAVYEEGRARYICYALAAEDKDNPPEEIRNVCSFVPRSPLLEEEGFFVLFQSAATGECIKPPRG